ncbi:hypothetical protein [Gordonia sp. NPDC003422]
MTSAIFALIGVGILVVGVLAFRMRWRVGEIASAVAVICLGLAYDNFAVAVGRFVGYGDALMAINVPRYWIHAFFVPLLIPIAGVLVYRLGVKQIGTRNVVIPGLLLVAMLEVIGIITDIVRLDLEPENAGDALRYVNAGASGPPIASVVTVLALIVLGGMAARYSYFKWLLVGALAMLFAAAAGTAVLWLGNLGELILMITLLATMAKVADREADLRLEAAATEGNR